MRVLLCTLPQRTHFLTMVPLMWALRTAGHEVRVACPPSFTGVVTQAGLPATPVGRSVDLTPMDLPGDREEGSRWLPDPYEMGLTDAEAWTELKRRYDTLAIWSFKQGNLPMIAELVELARRWRPDLVLWEPMTYSGPIAAKACGAAHARLMFTMDVFGVTIDRYRRLNATRPPAERGDALLDWLSGYARRYDFDVTDDLVFGHFTVDQLPASLRIGADLEYVPVRYLPYGGAAVVPRWLWENADRPRVAFTFGLTATEYFDGYAVGLREVFAALAGADVDVVATVAGEQRHRLGRIPDNVRLVSYVPLHALAPTCAAVVHHGGFGTLSTIALAGVPQLILPHYFEGPMLAERFAKQGAGLALAADEATGPAVREHVLRLLSEPTFVERAADLRAEMLALPSPNQLVARLAELTDRHRTTDR
jgi:glycosyltransferase (activator-dependent family)